MFIKKLSLVIFASLSLVFNGGAQFVSTTAGNVYLTDAAGKTRQLTSGGRDSKAVLSPDGKWVVFVRATSGEAIQTGADDYKPTELWQIAANGEDATLLVRCRNSTKTDNVIAEFNDIQFSSNGRYVFFTTPAYATSGAVHVVDTTNAKEHFICPGNGLEVLHSGEYRDYLLIGQHRYFLGGGTYDWWWLFTSDGKEVGPVGEDTSNFKELYLRK
jgi:dipeptidyl aminopeptidase/acylaminoacyl peptidase